MDLTSEVLVAAVDPVASRVHDALTEGWSYVGEVHDLMTIKPDRWLDSGLARTCARQRLEASAPPSGVPWGIDRSVPNSGIHLAVPMGHIRVLQGAVRRVPTPGRNPRRQRFYCQQQPSTYQPRFPGFADASEDALPLLNLLLLWDVRGKSIELTVAVPNGLWHHTGTERLLASVPLGSDFDAIEGEFEAGDDDGSDLVGEIYEAPVDAEIGDRSS